MSNAKTDAGFVIPAECTTAMKQWCLLNELQPNANKSEVLLVGTAYQLQAAPTVIQDSIAYFQGTINILPFITSIKANVRIFFAFVERYAIARFYG